MAPPLFLILAFDHPLRAVESVGEGMGAGLRSLGIAAQVLSLPRDNAKLAVHLAEPPAGMLSLGPLPLSTLVDGAPLHRRLRCPVWLYFLDAVIYDLSRVPVTRTFLADAAGDRRLIPVTPEAGYLRLLGRQHEGGFWPTQTAHVPFGCFPRLQVPVHSVPRQSRVCVIGTIGSELGGGHAGESLQQLLARVRPAGVADHHLDALAQVMLSPRAPIVPAQAVMRVLGWGPQEVTAPGNVGFVCAVDSWTKRERRLAAVRSLVGMPVDFYGHGWNQVFANTPDFRYVGQVAHDDIAALSRHYGAVLNFDPNWAAGVHDRVYTACAMGVPVLTNDNSALDHAGLPLELLYVYDPNRPALAAPTRRALANCPEPALPRLDVLKAHGWMDRMSRLMETFDGRMQA
jgi:hypothetical protein